MFSGIIEEQGDIESIAASPKGARLTIKAQKVLEDTAIGDSIAVNGICLTVVELSDKCWSADAVEETLKRTNLDTLREGSKVNLERAVRLDQRLGGHLVQGHVDGTAKLTAKQALEGGSWQLTFQADPSLLRYVVEKGSIAIDGISLTVAALTSDGFMVAIIPHTAAVTTLGSQAQGSLVNIEVDIIAKYVERLSAPLVA